MDYRKNMNTPREMIDDEMLRRLMRENEPVAATFGGNMRRENRRRENDRNGEGNCGCRMMECRDRREERSSESRCGCERIRENRSGSYERCEEREERSSRRECEHENENRRRNSDCGCERRERREREDRSSRENGKCGCDRQERREEHDKKNCGCEREKEERCEECSDKRCANDDRMRGFPLAMAYVPMQEWEGIFDDDVAISRGTLFEALDLPWYHSACDDGSGSCRKCGDKR